MSTIRPKGLRSAMVRGPIAGLLRCAAAFLGGGSDGAHAVEYRLGWFDRIGCSRTTTPCSNVEFWAKKFTENVARDERNLEKLRDAGWIVVVAWECDIKGDATKIAFEMAGAHWAGRGPSSRRATKECGEEGG
jgi:hypothetical protein